MENQTELKPCPFCGSEDVRLRWNMGTATYGVFCRGCVSDILMYFEVRDEAIKAWNRRAGDPDENHTP